MKGNGDKRAFALMFILMITLLVSTMSTVGLWGKFDLSRVKSILKIAGNNKTSQIETVKNDDNGRITERDADDEIQAEDAFFGAVQKASGSVLIEQSSRRVLKESGMNVRCYPASTTKVLTALTVLKNLPLEQIVTVPKEAEGVEGSSIYLRAGQNISVEDLLYGLMLRSGNDAAVALAIATAGSVEAFAVKMNEVAYSAGAVNSHFVNPHGLQDENHYATAYDLAMICAEAYELDDFKRIVGTKIARINIDGESVAIANKNKLLKTYVGANGAKTGYTKTSGRCLVGGAERDGMQLISVVLNCPDMWNATAELLDFGFKNFFMARLDDALLYGGSKEVTVKASQNVTSDWLDIKYPLRKDGSERLAIDSSL